MLPVLYSFRRCPYAMRARMALLYAGVKCELREVVLRDKPAEMLEKSPKGTVPVLVLTDGAVIDESLEIMQWALTHHDPDGWLKADDLLPEIIARNDGDFKYHLDRYKYPERYAPETDAVFHRKQAERFVAELDDRLCQHRYLCGEQTSLADVALFPFIRQFAAVEPAWFAATPYGSLRAWLDAWQQSELFSAAMIRYPQWHAGDVQQLLPCNS
ncbi:glutathione S-transferase [Mariprofundus ferrooxydans]|uniref:glutathione S-transferase n=1 Tax=Mariprofundus ferrooxydans TaxID=314344 RepID=UPI00142FF83E|nr:glutathione S-transferase [Mariprofundus ferrooxydans]